VQASSGDADDVAAGESGVRHRVPTAKACSVPERERSEARHPPPLDRLPWDLAKDEFKAQGRDLLEVLARVLLAGMKDEIR
jgi:hypothetical protein